MNLVFIVRDSADAQPGGDVNQLRKTMEALKLVRPHWNLSSASVSEYVSDRDNRNKYDVVIVHNICRPSDIIKIANFTASKLVISAIYVDFQAISLVSDRNLYKFLARYGFSNALEYAKSIIKGILGREAMPPSKFLFQGYKKSIRSAIRSADLMLVNSENELKRLALDLGFKNISDNDLQKKVIKFIPGTSLEQIPARETVIKSRRDIDVICVARLDEGKGQLHIIEELSDTGLNVVIVGGPLDTEYAKTCITKAGSNITFTGHLAQSEIQAYLLRSRIHILNSAFEVFGLVTLDAALCGCHVICTDRGDQIEHFQDIAVITSRNDENLLQTIRKLMSIEPKVDQSKLIEKFDWLRAAGEISRGIEKLFNV